VIVVVLAVVVFVVVVVIGVAVAIVVVVIAVVVVVVVWCHGLRSHTRRLHGCRTDPLHTMWAEGKRMKRRVNFICRRQRGICFRGTNN
jgi:hypothetical protein